MKLEVETKKNKTGGLLEIEVDQVRQVGRWTDQY